MIPLAILLAFGFLFAFLWAVRQGQFDDLVSPAHRILFDDETENKTQNQTNHPDLQKDLEREPAKPT